MCFQYDLPSPLIYPERSTLSNWRAGGNKLCPHTLAMPLPSVCIWLHEEDAEKDKRHKRILLGGTGAERAGAEPLGVQAAKKREAA